MTGQTKGEIMIKGWVTPFGYMGYLEGKYQLFATEDEYREIVRERNGILS